MILIFRIFVPAALFLCCLNKVSLVHVQKRSSVFIKNSAIGYLVAIAVPIDLSSRNVFLSFNFEANYALPFNKTHRDFIDKWNLDGERETINNNFTNINTRNSRSLYNRRNFYSTMKKHIQNFGFNGHSCLLRIICEISAFPLTEHNGLLGSLMHILFLPTSSKREKMSPDFYQAEEDGKQNGCQKYYLECSQNLLELVSTLSKE